MNDEYEFKDGIRIKKQESRLYSKMPIPAYKYLGSIDEHFAKDVLICLVSFLGLQKESNVVFPSIELIMSLTERGERSVRQGLKVLIAKGFISKKTTRRGKFQNNQYTIFDACYTYTPEMRAAIASANQKVKTKNRLRKQPRASLKTPPSAQSNKPQITPAVDVWGAAASSPDDSDPFDVPF